MIFPYNTEVILELLLKCHEKNDCKGRGLQRIRIHGIVSNVSPDVDSNREQSNQGWSFAIVRPTLTMTSSGQTDDKK